MTGNNITKIIGVTEDNFDEHSRQEIIRVCVLPGDILYTKHDTSNPNKLNAIAVYANPKVRPWANSDYKIGYLNDQVSNYCVSLIDSKGRVNCHVIEKTPGPDGKSIDVTVEVRFYTPEVVAKYYAEHPRVIDKPSPDNKPTQQPVNLISSQPRQASPSRNYTTITSDKSKKTAMLLCIFGGFFGLHYFYVGRVGRGFLYMFTLGLCMFGWIGDMISIGVGSFRDAAGAPLRQ